MVDAQGAFFTNDAQFPAASEAVFRAALVGDVETVRYLVDEGADLNVFGSLGNCLLEEIIFDLLSEPSLSFQASDIVRLLIDLGADPNLISPDGSVALVPAMLHMDVPMLRTLLEGGANPNPEGGVCDGGILYDWAWFDYQLEVWSLPGFESHLCDGFEADSDSEEAWLSFVDRKAIEHGVRRPDHLMLLREFGARSASELKGDQGDSGNKPPKSSTLPPARDLQDAKDFLALLVRDGWDWSDLSLADHLKALHNQHSNDPAFMALFEQAANVYSNAVVARAKQALRSFGEE